MKIQSILIFLLTKYPPSFSLFFYSCLLCSYFRTWKEGEFIVFDDSFEHEVWHRGVKTRLVLIVDLWHPDLTAKQKSQLSPI